MKKTLSEEREYIEFTLKILNQMIEDTKLRIKKIPEAFNGNASQIANIISEYTEILERLIRSKNNPYFGRIDFKGDDEEKTNEYYIGKVGLIDHDTDKEVVIDWRAPISSLYYNSNIGKVSYEAPYETINGEMYLKRQYTIESGELKSFEDVDLVSNDSILNQYLSKNSDTRSRNIVTTIQAEQNEIIREKINQNIIVQGVAGSGKTVVALHRIAYLIYNNIQNIKPSQYLVIGPNTHFMDYISSVLPDLEVENVNQLTYEKLLRELTHDKFTVINDEEKIKRSININNNLRFEKLRVSLEYKILLDKFMELYEDFIILQTSFNIRGYEIVNEKVIRQIYNEIGVDRGFEYESIKNKIDSMCAVIRRYIENHYDTISSRINDEYYLKIKYLSKDQIEKEQKNKKVIEKELKNYCNQTLKKHFYDNIPSLFNVYEKFLNNLEISNLNNIELKDIKSTVKNVKKRKIESEDFPALIYLYTKIFGSSIAGEFRHVVIDEAQDYGEFNFFALKKLMPKATYSIFGDLSQTIYAYRGINSWEQLAENVFGENCKIVNLNKSYRSTSEIVESANQIKEYIGQPISQPISRHGMPVNYNKIEENEEILISKIIKENMEAGYESIGIISKDNISSIKLVEKLLAAGIELTIVSNPNDRYYGGVCAITSHLSKGMEFDCVIVADASENMYNSNSMVDMKLLYITMTRALHELYVLYKGKLTNPLQTINLETYKQKKLIR